MKHSLKMESDNDSLRSINRSKILNLLQKKESLARNQIADYIGLTAASVTRIVNECIDAELIIEQKNADSTSGAGRRPIPLSLNPKTYFVTGVHLGKFWIDIGLLNLSGEVISYSRYNRPNNVTDTLNLIKRTITDFQNQYNARILSIGVTLYGQVDIHKGTILEQNVLGWESAPIRSWLETELGINTVMDTNIYSMAYAEYNSNPLPSDQALLFISIGTTIGIGTVVNNVVIRGKQGVAGILEHYPWFESSPACECGKVGCITAVLSDRSLLEQAKNMHEELHIQDINDLVTYSKNYPDIKQLLKKRAFKAGELIAKLAVLHDPARIVLSGSLLIDGYQQMEWVQESFKNIMNPVNGKYAYIENPTSRYSNVPFTLIGAGTIAINKSLSSSLLLKKDPTTNSTKGTVAYLPL